MFDFSEKRQKKKKITEKGKLGFNFDVVQQMKTKRKI